MGKRFRDVRRMLGDKERSEFADDLGLSVTAVAKYERGEAEPTAGMLAPYIRIGVDLAWLITGQGSMLAGPQRNTQLQFIPDVSDHMVTIPQFDIRAAAGSGALVQSENVSSYFTVERDWLRRMLPGWASTNAAIGILENSGDSMEPTIRDGDMVMVVQDPPQRIIDGGGVFLVLHHGHLRIKRLHVDIRTGDVSLISDNDRYPTEIVLRNRVEFDLDILAQVFFGGGKLRA